jgi:hypothetical protein
MERIESRSALKADSRAVAWRLVRFCAPDSTINRSKGPYHTDVIIVQRDLLSDPENQTTKAPRKEEVKERASFVFVPSCFISYLSL